MTPFITDAGLPRRQPGARSILMVMVIIGASSFQLCSHAFAQNSRLSPQLSPKLAEFLDSPAVELKEDDGALLKLKKQRFNSAIAESKERSQSSRRTSSRLLEVLDALERAFSAQQDLAQSPEERVSILKKQLEIVQEEEETLATLNKQGKVLVADLERLRYERFGIEIDLDVLNRGLAR